MDIENIKKFMKEKKLTYDTLSKLSGIPLNTIKNIFRGKTQNPRIDTMQAIEKALGIEDKQIETLSSEEIEFIKTLRTLTAEEKQKFLAVIGLFVKK